MDIRQLHYFVQIIESGSLSKASRQLHLAQPALSQQLAKLEDEVGKPLLRRSSKGVTPTDNGFALYHHARFMLRQFDQALPIARSGAGAVQGMVSVGLSATTVAAIGLPLVQRTTRNYPGVLLNIVEGMSGHIAQLLRLGQLDLAVLFSNDVTPDLAVEPLLEEELFLMIPAHSHLVPSGHTSIGIREAAEIPLILPTGSHGLRQRITAEFTNQGLNLNVIAEIDSLSLLMNCVHAGMGATIKPMGAVMQESARGRQWRCLSFSDAVFRRQDFLYSLPAERLTAAAAVVKRELKSTVAEILDCDEIAGFKNVGANRLKVAPDA